MNAENLTKAAAMSKAFRAGLGELASGRDGVKLRPNELRLGYQICLETFDEGLTDGRVELDRWARLLELRDAKGFRPDKAASILKTLTELGIVDVNAAQATFEPRPEPSLWLRARAMRARAICGSTTGQAGATPAELPLRSERPLSEALSELSRETAMGQPSEKSDDVRRQNPTMAEPAVFASKSAPSAKSDDDPRARERLGTCTRFGKALKTFTRDASEKSDAEVDPRWRRRVMERVRAFVGDVDWARKGSWGSAYYVWKSAAEIRKVEGCLDYLLAGIREKTVRIERTPGAALWWYYRHFEEVCS